MPENKLCPQCGKPFTHYRRTFCSMACWRAWNASKTNDIHINGDAAYIQLSNGMVAIVDAVDVPRIRSRRWSASRSRNQWYVVSGKGGGLTYLHRIIIGAEDGQKVDHRDRDGLNNRRSNLRIATPSQNGRNRIVPRGVSGYRGVSWVRRRRKWQASLKRDGRRIYGGQFTDVVEAAKAYNELAKSIDGENAILNDV